MKTTPKAAVTNIVGISNNFPEALSLLVGESGQRINIERYNVWSGSLWVPWIGNQDEAFKAISYSAGSGETEQNGFIYQDYWYPPGKNTVKYFRGKNFIYDQNNPAIRGNSSGGGEKTLVIDRVAEDLYLTLL